MHHTSASGDVVAAVSSVGGDTGRGGFDGSHERAGVGTAQTSPAQGTLVGAKTTTAGPRYCNSLATLSSFFCTYREPKHVLEEPNHELYLVRGVLDAVNNGDIYHAYDAA